jgi:hypothetical protein
VKRTFRKGLSQEFREGPVPVNPPLFPAANDDRSNLAVALDFVGAGVSLSLRSQDPN